MTCTWEEALDLKFGKGSGRLVTCDEFKGAFPEETQVFFAKLFETCEECGTGTVPIDDLRERLRHVDSMPDVQKLRFILELTDDDASGLISVKDLLWSFRIWASSAGVADHLDEYLGFIQQTLHLPVYSDDEGEPVGIDEILREVERSRVLSFIADLNEYQTTRLPRCGALTSRVARTRRYLRYNRRKVLWVLAYVLVSSALVVNSIFVYDDHSTFVVLARLSGNCLHFNAALLIALMLRHCLTHLRMTRWAKYLPIDQHVLLHKMVGMTTVILAVVHTVGHTMNVVVSSGNLTSDVAMHLFTAESEVGYFYGAAYPIGWLLFILLILMAASSVVCVRRKYFKVFYGVHHLYVAFLIGLIIHTSNFWKWIIAPGILLLLEKVWCSDVFRKLRYYKSYITEVARLPNGVTKLTIERPNLFRFRPGDFVFLQIPTLSRFEWHPFSISSAPEDTDTFTCHLRNSGDWTGRLATQSSKSKNPGGKQAMVTGSPLSLDTQQLDTPSVTKSGCGRDNPAFDEVTDGQDTGTGLESRCNRIKEPSSSRELVYIDGPFGTPTRRLFDTDHVILIATGIGVTPYASVLQSIVYDCKRTLAQCPGCSHAWITGNLKYSNLKKVDFVWINRDVRNLEWFESLLSSIEERKRAHDKILYGPVIKVHLYVTSDPKQPEDEPKAGVEFGRPEWSKLFREFKEEGSKKVKVFFCGTPTLAKVIKRHSMENRFLFRKETF